MQPAGRRGGIFTVSLDFELYWGVRDRVRLDEYRQNLAGVREVVPRLLDLFRRYEIHATWATVGFLFFDTKQELLQHLPANRPHYADATLSPYEHIADIGPDERSDIFHFAPSLIREVAATPHQEVGTHTFSHYYCLDRRQTSGDFRADLVAALLVAEEKLGRKVVSLVFPRNQINQSYLPLCRELGITAYRGNDQRWFDGLQARGGGRPLWRVLHLLDTYVNIAGPRSYPLPDGAFPLNVPASRFLRPYSPRRRLLDPLRLRRITSALEAAARRNEIFHLWWHPHNFGVHQQENLAFLERILARFSELRRALGMRSLSMGEIAREHG